MCSSMTQMDAGGILGFAMAAVMNIEGLRALGSSVFETVVNKSESVKNTKKVMGDDLDPTTEGELSEEE